MANITVQVKRYTQQVVLTVSAVGASTGLASCHRIVYWAVLPINNICMHVHFQTYKSGLVTRISGILANCSYPVPTLFHVTTHIVINIMVMINGISISLCWLSGGYDDELLQDISSLYGLLVAFYLSHAYILMYNNLSMYSCTLINLEPLLIQK